MIQLKTPDEIEIIATAGKMLAQVKDAVRAHIDPGITLKELDKIAEAKIIELGGEPAFKRVYEYKYATCINVNSGVVHGIPNNYEVRPGDKVSVDVGIFYKGFNTDSAFTTGVKPLTRELDDFIQTGQKILETAINEVRPGNRIGHISQTINDGLKNAGYSPSLLFTGHGVGRDLHEDPPIPCYFVGKLESTPIIGPGMVLAIEVIYTQGKPEVKIGADGWTASTKDGKIGGLFEETVAVTENGPRILTR